MITAVLNGHTLELPGHTPYRRAAGHAYRQFGEEGTVKIYAGGHHVKSFQAGGLAEKTTTDTVNAIRNTKRFCPLGSYKMTKQKSRTNDGKAHETKWYLDWKNMDLIFIRDATGQQPKIFKGKFQDFDFESDSVTITVAGAFRTTTHTYTIAPTQQTYTIAPTQQNAIHEEIRKRITGLHKLQQEGKWSIYTNPFLQAPMTKGAGGSWVQLMMRDTTGKGGERWQLFNTQLGTSGKTVDIAPGKTVDIAPGKTPLPLSDVELLTRQVQELQKQMQQVLQARRVRPVPQERQAPRVRRVRPEQRVRLA